VQWKIVEIETVNRQVNLAVEENEKLFEQKYSIANSACTVLTATWFIIEEGQRLCLYRYETPKPIDVKFGTGDCVGDTTPDTKFDANSSTANR